MAGPETAPRPVAGRIRYWAAAKAAAGTAEEPYRAATLAEALAAARERHTARPEFAQVLRRCSFLVDGTPVGTRDHTAVPLPDGGTVEVLPPFAGG
ncbi:MoaD/ThiS family protein [Streptomyces sp. NBC_01190]|uniref:MoaD/ThiS family protein n=1 Tax=Streptomyces sp. NBC_01190 TaxID=2903767 RepID=UPI00386565DF|nr:MoaD/ThiS family protein [Streptomyces sp. NBC_01190]